MSTDDSTPMGQSPKGPSKLVVLLGTRPEAIKLAPVILEFREKPGIEAVVCATGQHREMVHQVLAPFGIRPDVDLDLMQPEQTPNEVLRRATERLDILFKEIRPQMVVVQGDTTSALAGALSAFYGGMRVAHVEAGLRSYDRFHPFPEEANRRMISAVADLHLAPTQQSADNLLREGIERDAVVVTGNTAVDAIHFVLKNPVPGTSHVKALAEIAPDRGIVLITLHRRESWMPHPDAVNGDAQTILEMLAYAILEAVREHPDHVFLYPVHPNSRVREPVHRILGGVENVRLLEPLPYVEFILTMARAQVILTDSGGIQEEAPSMGKPVLVLRRTTERPEGVQSASNRLVGTDPTALIPALRKALLEPPVPQESWPCPNPFGDGRAAARIRRAVLHFLGRGPAPEEFRAQPSSDLLPKENLV